MKLAVTAFLLAFSVGAMAQEATEKVSVPAPPPNSVQAPVNTATASSMREECEAFGAMAPQFLEEMAHMPPRLPSFIPGCGGNVRPHANLVVALPSQYEIELMWDKNCGVAEECEYGTIQGGSAPPVMDIGKGPRVPVILKGGINGSFVPPYCVSGSCGGSSIIWTEGGYYYAVGLVGETKETLIEVANSAIDDVFGSVKPALLQETHVPLRLPTLIPDSGDREHPLYAILQSTEPSSYEIEIGWVPDCRGENVCYYGTVRGSSAPLAENEGRKVPVILQGGIKGYFIDFTCGAHCDDGAMGWTENGYHYSIALKAGDRKTLTRMANSAIKSAGK